MIIKGIIPEDFINYKIPCMTIEFPYCTFKCDKECGMKVCQNSDLVKAKDLEITVNTIVRLYKENDIVHALCFQGLEPFDSFQDMLDLINVIRCEGIQDDIVIYTGYNEDEIQDKLSLLKGVDNIIIKFGRYIPNSKPVYSELLGVYLASENQYAIKL